jgi:xylitol oxidase
VGLHFTWFPRSVQVRKAAAEIESALAPFEARPHWGKVFVDQGGRVPSLYPRLADFRELRAAWDPSGKFLNTFVRRHLGH